MLLVLEDHSPVGGLGDAVRRVQMREVVVFGVEGWPTCGTPREALAEHGLDGALARRAGRIAARDACVMAKTVWFVLPDPFPTRVFVDCGIVEKLADRLQPFARRVGPAAGRGTRRVPRLGGVSWEAGEDLFPEDVGVIERAARRLDLALDRNVGYYPLSVRHSLRHGFNRERMRPGHPNIFLDSSRTGRLPESQALDRVAAMALLTAPAPSSALVSRMRDGCSGAVVANVQSLLQAVLIWNAARRLRLPVVGYVASWDHTVGKGLVHRTSIATSCRTPSCGTISYDTTRSPTNASSSRAGHRATSSRGADLAASTALSSRGLGSIRAPYRPRRG